MNRNYLFVLLLSFATWFVHAQAPTVRPAANTSTLRSSEQFIPTGFGYADRSKDPKSGVLVGYGADNEYLSPAIGLPAMTAGSIKGVTFYAGTANESAVIFVIDKDNKVIALKEVKAVWGWNQEKFDTPVQIEKGNKYRIGYTVISKGGHLEDSCMPCRYDGDKVMTFPEGLYFYYSNKQTKHFELGEVVKIANWYVSQEFHHGSPYIFVDVDDPKGELANRAVVSGGVPVMAETGKAFDIKVKIRNLGSNPVTKCKIEYDINGTKSADITCDVPAMSNGYVKMQMPAMSKGKGELTLKGLSFNGVDSYYPKMASKVVYSIYDASMMFENKTLLIERFTTEKCGNCPSSDPEIEGVVKAFTDEGYEIITVAHHIGFGEDWLTLDGSKQLIPTFFKEENQTFAPSVSFNRTVTSTKHTMGDLVMSVKMPIMMIAGREVFATPTPCLIDGMTQSVTEDKKLNLTLTGKVGDACNTDDLYCTVYLVEDNVKAQSQAGAGSAEFWHQGVIRSFATPAKGVALTPHVKGGQFTIELNQIEVNPSWKGKDLRVVAFVHQSVNSSDKEQRKVYTAIQQKIQGVLPIDAVSAASPIQVFCTDGRLQVVGDYKSMSAYALSGQLLSLRPGDALVAGCYIIVVTDVAGVQSAHKVVVP